MAQTIRGVQPLKWGTNAADGFIVESVDNSRNGQEVTIEDETGEVVTHISGFGVTNAISISVIPLSTVALTLPNPGDVFTWGTDSTIIVSIDKKQVRKDVEKWSIKGKSFDAIALS